MRWLVSSLILPHIPKDSPNFPPDFHSLSPICKSLSKIIEPCISMRARLIRWSEAEAGFDLCPQVLRREIWSQGHSHTAMQSTLHQRDDWTHTCWATPAPDGTIVVANGKDEREKEQEGGEEREFSQRNWGFVHWLTYGQRGYIHWSVGQKKRALAWGASEWVYLGFGIPVHSHQELFHHLTPQDLQLLSPIVHVMHRAIHRPKANQCFTRGWYRSY